MDSTLTQVLISLGSNCGRREEAVAKAREWLASLMDCVRWSGVYETDPISGEGSRYMNAVVSGSTGLPAEELERLTKEYEREQGRDDECRMRGDVPIDIDVVAYGDQLLRPRDYKSSYFIKGLGMLAQEK